MTGLDQKRISISLAGIGLLMLLVCSVVPLFSFWNYRLCMCTLLPVSMMSLLVSLKRNTVSINIVGGILSIVCAGAILWFSGLLESALICAGICCLIAIVMITQNKAGFLKRKVGVVCFTVGVSVLALIFQARTVFGYYHSYEAVVSGAYDVPEHVAELMLTAAIDEAGMMVVILCLLFSLGAVCINYTAFLKDGEERYVPNVEKEASADSLKKREIEIDNIVRKNNFCRKCGTRLMSDSCFCSHCGTKIE